MNTVSFGSGLMFLIGFTCLSGCNPQDTDKNRLVEKSPATTEELFLLEETDLRVARIKNLSQQNAKLRERVFLKLGCGNESIARSGSTERRIIFLKAVSLPLLQIIETLHQEQAYLQGILTMDLAVDFNPGLKDAPAEKPIRDGKQQ